MIVDSHIHLWGDAVVRADWLASARTAPIRRRFTLTDYAAAVAGTGIGSAVVVTAERSVRETTRLIDEGRRSALVAGIVGWLDLSGSDDELARELLGIRLSVVDEAADWLDRADIRAGISRFARTGRVLELLVSPRDLPAVARCAEAHPATTIVVDHLGNPTSAPEDWEMWRRGMGTLAARDNIRMKLSGDGLTAASIDVALEAFGTTRLMFGSDWPVSLLRAPLDVTVETHRRATSALSDHERGQLFAATAIDTYGLAG